MQALKAQNIEHPRIVGLIKTCEESGSYDLLPCVNALKDRHAAGLPAVASCLTGRTLVPFKKEVLRACWESTG